MKGAPGGVPIRRRVVLLGIALVILNAYWVGKASEIWYAVYTLVSPFSNAIFTLGVLLALNVLAKRAYPSAALTPQELLLIYVMVTMVSTISGHAFMAILMGTLAHPFWFATVENQYVELFGRFIPEWATVRDVGVLRDYFEGDSTLYVREHVLAWLTPVLFWSALIVAFYGSLLGFSLILRQHWMEHEKLTYPLTELPLQMATSPAFFRSRVMWIGFGISTFIRVIDGLHDLFPVVPAFPPNYRLDAHFTERPWSAMGYLSMSFNTAIVGLAYFMPLDLSFSTWFFFWLTRLERVIADVAGWQDLRLNDRAAGAWVGIALIVAWSARRHIAEVVRSAFAPPGERDPREPFSYRTLVVLTGAATVASLGFCLALGLKLWVVIVFYALFLAFALSIAYVRAALGPPYHEVIGFAPRQLMVEIFGTRRLGAQNLTGLTLLYAFNRCNRSHPMPNQAEMLRIGDRSDIARRPLVWAMVLAIGIGVLATFWAYLDFSYGYGVLARARGWVGNFGWESYNPLQRWIQSPTPSDLRGSAFMLAGMGFVLLLQGLRSRLIWFPLHGSGYVLSGADWGGMIYFWFPVMVGWFLKSLIVRFGGMTRYRALMPAFLGLVLGDFMLRSVLSLISVGLDLYMPSSGSGHTL